MCYVNNNLSKYEYQSLKTGDDLNAKLGHYRIEQNSVVESLLNCPVNNGEITVDWYPAINSGRYGMQVLRRSLKGTSSIYIRSKIDTSEFGEWICIATKSDLSAYATNAQLQSTFINISNKRYVKITASENNSNYGIIFAVTSQGILCVYSVNGNFTTLFESTGNRVKISASGLVTTIDCVASYTHGFILRGGSLKNMPYEIS